MRESRWLEQAFSFLREARGAKQTMEQRAEQAIELAALILEESKQRQTAAERKEQLELAAMLGDPGGKAFVTQMTDQCFRSETPRRTAEQLIFLLDQFGVPKYLSPFKRLQLASFRFFGRLCPWLIVPIVKAMIRRQTARVIIPGEPTRLQTHLRRRIAEGVRVNLNHLGEAILGEEEAETRLQTYLEDLSKPEVEVISVKISTIFSQINPLSWEKTLESLATPLARLYRAAMRHRFVRLDGTEVMKFVNLDMEEYGDLALTVALFQRLLDRPEFLELPAGIVLQAYLPDSYGIQRTLTEWALKRVAKGGAPIKIRIVKGANLAMEQVSASLHGWLQAPYMDKAEVDANFKKMVLFALEPGRAKAVHIGIGSHNLFDIAFAMLLRAENGLDREVEFEMLEGMADPIRRVVQELVGSVLLYCPSATEKEFQNAVAYLIRRLDENTAPQNFLRHSFQLVPGSLDWDQQASFFREACKQSQLVSLESRRTQDLGVDPVRKSPTGVFVNEPEADWSQQVNRIWLENQIVNWRRRPVEQLPLVIGGRDWTDGGMHEAKDPSMPEVIRYRYVTADIGQLDIALQCAKNRESGQSLTQRAALLREIAHQLRLKRGELIASMMFTCGKTAAEGDLEIVEAIDFAEYYSHNILEWVLLQDISWSPKGTVVVAPPWNFPCSIPLGGIVAALATGNCVLFKPAPEAVYIGWQLANLCWDAGVSKEVLQFIPCEDDPAGSALIKDPRVNAVLLTGATATAKHLLSLRPDLNLIAETGGKNAIILTAMCDRDLAIKEVIRSAFGHAGQKCSACSLLICQDEVYDDPHFFRTLRDAAASLPVGPAWDLKTSVNPLIHEPNPELLRGLTQLETGEEWLLKPEPMAGHPNLWSPGIKLGVKPGSYMHLTELFGPVLAVMRAKDLPEAIAFANGTPYGLTSGIHSLDVREQEYWIDHIEAGNCYINRTITGAIVQRQPFGGCKNSSFGPGAKAGGPNYLAQLMVPKQTGLPMQRAMPMMALHPLFEYHHPQRDQVELWNASLSSYAYVWNHYFKYRHDPSQVIGQDNFFFYRPRKTFLRVQEGDTPLDLLRVCAAAMICGAPLEVSGAEDRLKQLFIPHLTPSSIVQIHETEEQFIERLARMSCPSVRLVFQPSLSFRRALINAGARIRQDPILANGRIELLNYLREVSLSIDYHRYGNLGTREHN